MDCPKRNALAGLPDEAMLEILARAPFKSVCRSKCVAKAWRDLIDDPLNRRRLPQTLQGFFSISYPKHDFDRCIIKYSAISVPPDIDPCLPFPMKLLEYQRVRLADSCNGLLLFKHIAMRNPFDVVGYIVCNPATKQWATIPICACCLQSGFRSRAAIFASHTYLVFDPVVSSHFHLIQFFRRRALPGRTYLSETYSSETGVWSHIHTDWNEQGQLGGWRRQSSPSYGFDQRTLVNGILHLRVKDSAGGDQIVAENVEGRTKRTIKMPAAAQGRCWHSVPYIGQSQGHLHYINQDFDAHDARQVESYELSIWELQDYETQEWVLKDTLSFLRLFGRERARRQDFNIVAIHPDRNVVFFAEPLRGLIAYDMDHKEVSAVAASSEILGTRVVPYIPYFSESPALTNKN